MKKLWSKVDLLLKFAVIIATFCLIFISAHSTMHDPDIWLHLKTGEFILQHKTVPTFDIFSFTMQAKPWVDHEWLFQVITKLIYSRWQADGLIFLQSLMIIFSFALLLMMGLKNKVRYLEIVILLMVTVFASSARFNIRPELFSLFFFVLYLYSLNFHTDKKKIWLLIPVQVIWVNLHGYFFLGPLLTLFFIFDEYSRRRFKFLSNWRKNGPALKEDEYTRLKRLFGVMLLACLINPYGLKGALYPLNISLDILTGKNRIFFEYIQELKPTFWRGIGRYMNSFYLLATACFLTLVVNFRKVKITEIILFLFFFLFSFKLRNVAYFAFVCYIILISYINPTQSKIFSAFKVETKFKNVLYILFKYGLVFLFLFWAVSKTNYSLKKFYYDFESGNFKSHVLGLNEKYYPVKAVDFILGNNIPANLFNDFNSGAYLVGRAYPERKVFTDGRTELYGDDFFKRYLGVMEADKNIFEEVMEEYRIGGILLTLISGTPEKILKYLSGDPQWKLVFFDDSAVVFLKDIPSNCELIKKYKIELNNYRTPVADLKTLGLIGAYPQPYINRANLFYAMGEDEAAHLECAQALRTMPNCAEALCILGKIYLRKGNYQEAFDKLRAAALFIPRNAEILLNLGICLKEMKEDKAALNTLKGALKVNSRYDSAYYHLGCIYLNMDKPEEAIKALKKAVEYNSKDARYYLKLGEALYAKGIKSQDNAFVLRGGDFFKKALELSAQDRKLREEIEGEIKKITKGL